MIIYLHIYSNIDEVDVTAIIVSIHPPFLAVVTRSLRSASGGGFRRGPHRNGICSINSVLGGALSATTWG